MGFRFFCLVALCALAFAESPAGVPGASLSSLPSAVVKPNILPSSVTVTTHESWFDLMEQSLTSVLVGIVLFIISFPLLIWNECKAASAYRLLGKARSSVKEGSSNPTAQLEGKLVHVVDKAEKLQSTVVHPPSGAFSLSSILVASSSSSSSASASGEKPASNNAKENHAEGDHQHETAIGKALHSFQSLLHRNHDKPSEHKENGAEGQPNNSQANNQHQPQKENNHHAVPNLVDPDFRLVFPTALKYERTVKMYQYYEESSKSESRHSVSGKDTSVTYTLKQGWLEHHASLPHFPHLKNPAFPVQARSGAVEAVKFGEKCRLSSFLINALPSGAAPRLLRQPDVLNFPPEICERADVHLRECHTLTSSSDHAGIERYNSPVPPPYSEHSGSAAAGNMHLTEASADEQGMGHVSLLIGKHVERPQVGDVLVTWRCTNEGYFSVMGRQQGFSYAPWEPSFLPEFCSSSSTPAENQPLLANKPAVWQEPDAPVDQGCCEHDSCGRQGFVLYIDLGPMSAENMIRRREEANKNTTNIIRLCGYLAMFFGLIMILDPVLSLLNFIPVVGTFAAKGIVLAAFIATLLVSIVVIAVSWFLSRPSMVLGLCAIVGLVFWAWPYFFPAATAVK